MKRTTTLTLTTNSKGLLKALSVPLAELEERMQANFVRLAQLGCELTEIHQDAFHWSRSDWLPVANMIHSMDSKASLGVLSFEDSYGQGVTEMILKDSQELEAISNKVREELIKNAMVVYGD